MRRFVQTFQLRGHRGGKRARRSHSASEVTGDIPIKTTVRTRCPCHRVSEGRKFCHHLAGHSFSFLLFPGESSSPCRLETLSFSTSPEVWITSQTGAKQPGCCEGMVSTIRVWGWELVWILPSPRQASRRVRSSQSVQPERFTL